MRESRQRARLYLRCVSLGLKNSRFFENDVELAGTKEQTGSVSECIGTRTDARSLRIRQIYTAREVA